MSKRRNTGYASGSSRHWVKTKCLDWKRENGERWRVFEKKARAQRARDQLKKKRAELARVLERLADQDLSPGMARELRKHVAALEREIAELEGEA